MSDRATDFDLDGVQEAIGAAGVDAWLFAQFHGRDPLATRVLGLPADVFQTRRWYYLIPAQGEPQGLVHAIEQGALEDLPGSRRRYRTWQELDAGLDELLEGVGTVAMQYSPQNRVPYVAMVDAGTVEAVRDRGIEVVSAADLIQRFTAVLDDDQIDSHRLAGERLPDAIEAAFKECRARLLAGDTLNEYELQRYLLQQVKAIGLTSPDEPIVAINGHAADPHYAPGPEGSSPIVRGDWLLIDVWAKQPGSEDNVFADITWTAQVDSDVSDRRVEVFETVLGARDAAIDLVQARYAAGEEVRGFEADRACREVLVNAGYGDAIQHRTGHSITSEIHGSGANLDDFESHDERLLMRRTCFSVEPGIYLEDDFGVRSEVDILVPPDGPPEVTGRKQTAMILLLADDPQYC
ncbi:MAG: M24 family metallopeptidase [Acidobacteria bacterium]|nr:M24 family metallopeptidase [Acidobacteriota bacterium]